MATEETLLDQLKDLRCLTAQLEKYQYLFESLHGAQIPWLQDTDHKTVTTATLAEQIEKDVCAMLHEFIAIDKLLITQGQTNAPMAKVSLRNVMHQRKTWLVDTLQYVGGICTMLGIRVNP